MSRLVWSPEEPLWKAPGALLGVKKMDHGWYPIDGIPANRHPNYKQLLIVGRGHQFLSEVNKEFGTLWLIGDHLGIARSEWKWPGRFLLNYVLAFLHQFKDWVVTVQVLPRRKTFRQIVVDGNPNPNQAQKVVTASFPFHAVCAPHMELPLAYNFRVPGSGLFMGSEDDYKERDNDADELCWTKVLICRSVPGPGARVNREHWFFMAHEGDRERIQQSGSIPVLENFFRDGVQEAPIISFCAIDPTGTWVQSHCFSLEAESDRSRHGPRILDLRQSQPSLEHHCRSAPHNHSGLGHLIYKERWSF